MLDNCHSVMYVFFFFKHNTAYEMRISDWSSDVCSSDLKLAVIEVASRNIEVLEFFPGANNLNPQFSSDGQSLYFLSNADGMRNLFQYRFEDGTVAKLTKYFTGISGITENAPAMSVYRPTEDKIGRAQV